MLFIFKCHFSTTSSLRFLFTLFSCSGGSLVAYADASPTNGVPSIASKADVGEKKKKVVVLGTGWAGTSFLKNIKDPSYEVQVISPRNYFAFTPLLPSVTCGTVEARSIVEPIRNIVRKVIDFSPFDYVLQELELICVGRLFGYHVLIISKETI